MRLIKYHQIVIGYDWGIGDWPVEIITNDELYLFSNSESDCLYFLGSNIIRYEGHSNNEIVIFEYCGES